MVEAKKNKRANAFKKVRRLFKEVRFIAETLNVSLTQGRKKK